MKSRREVFRGPGTLVVNAKKRKLFLSTLVVSAENGVKKYKVL